MFLLYFYHNENLKMEFRKATIKDFSAIWEIIKFAIESRRIDGSKQWQDGYPNTETILSDIESGYGYVLVENKQLLFYSAIIFDIEPAYEAIEGKWLTSGDYCTIHRMAVAPTAVSKGLATEMLLRVEALCKSKSIFSIKIDTNFDNPKMLHLIKKLGYSYCGEVYFRGEARKAFEKVLKIYN